MTTIYVVETYHEDKRRWMPLNGVRFSERRIQVEQWLADYQALRRYPRSARITPYVSQD